MRKPRIIEGRFCPYCKKETNQVNAGLTTAGSQRCFCKDCKKYYSPNKKKWAYNKTERQNALNMLANGVSGRSIGKTLNMAKSNVYRWAKDDDKH